MWRDLNWLLGGWSAVRPTQEQVCEFKQRAAAWGQLLCTQLGSTGPLAKQLAEAKWGAATAAAAAAAIPAAPAPAGKKQKRPRRATAEAASAKLAEEPEPSPPAAPLAAKPAAPKQPQQPQQPAADKPPVSWIPYIGMLVNCIWFLQELYGGLRPMSAAQFAAANAASKDAQLHHVAKGGVGSQQTSRTVLMRRALETSTAIKQEHASQQRPLKQYRPRSKRSAVQGCRWCRFGGRVYPSCEHIAPDHSALP